MVSVLTRWCAAPINPTNPKEEIRSELESTRALAIIIMAGAAGMPNCCCSYDHYSTAGLIDLLIFCYAYALIDGMM